MIKLKALSIEDRELLTKYYTAENSRSADFSFANCYLWDKRFRQSYAVVGERLIFRFVRNGETWFAFPVGTGDPAPAFEAMRELCREEGIPLRVCGICKENLPLLPEGFAVEADRDFSDYIYRVDSLASYAGRSLHAKKNYCNRFENAHDWHSEPLTPALIPACRELLSRWRTEEADRLSDSIVYEDDAIDRAFSHFEELGLEGCVLFAEGEAAAFSVGEKINNDTFCVHFEKALSALDGAYPMICRETARQVREKHPEIDYVNREEDMGLEPLRKSKLSYKPDYILEKYRGVRKL